MKIKLHSSSTLYDATVAMISDIDNSDFSLDHVIIVPDRFSLQCEKLILKLLPQKALFNVRVTSLTRFSVELLEKLGLKLSKGDVLSSGETLLLSQKAIENTSKDFITLKKSGIDFCYEVSKLIAQFKSSNITPKDLNTKAVGMAGNKYHDLALIYSEYEKLLGDKLDANARLALLNDKLKESNILQNTKIYFAHFEAFTKAGYNLIKTFMSCAKEVNISMTQALALGNEYIYEKDIQEKVVSLANECGAMVEVKAYPQDMTKQKNAIVKGLYSYQKLKCENNGYYNIYSCMSSAEEVESVAKLIRYQVYKGFKYKDIQIAAGNLNRVKSQIENIFNQYEIPVYIDCSITADKTLLGNLIRAYFETVIYGYNYDKLIDLFANPLTGGNQQLIEKCQHIYIDGKESYKKYIESEYINADILSKIEKSKKAEEFEKVVLDILLRAEQMHEDILLRLEENRDLKERNINVQASEIIKENLSLITRETKEDMSASEYFKLLSLLLSFRQVSTVPTYADGVFVGDATQSYFGESKVFIVMDGENLPAISNDNGLLSDDELKIHDKNPIEPTIRMLNRRSRFKLFSMLTLGNEQLFIFTQRLDEEGKKKEFPTYIKNLNDIFSQQELKAGNIFFSRKTENLSLALLSSPLKSHSVDNRYKKEWQSELCGDLSFREGKARVTQIEQYFSCPFKQFAMYGLKLREFEVKKFQPRDIGNICHKMAEVFLKSNINNDNLSAWTREELIKFIERKFDYVIESEDLTEKLDKTTEKKSLIKFIKNQMLVFLLDILYELKNTHFKPYKIEHKFDKCNIEGAEVSVVGKADRIDVCGDYLRIIDYKTGLTGNILKELYFGKKLQLFLYQKFAREMLNKRAGGIFYFDAKFNYDKDDQRDYLLKGLVPNEENLMPLLSTSLEEDGKSDILAVYKSKKDGSYKGTAISPYEMKQLEKYAEKITAGAIKEIQEGYIMPKPHEDSCRGCKLASLCGYEKCKGQRKLIKSQKD